MLQRWDCGGARGRSVVTVTWCSLFLLRASGTGLASSGRNSAYFEGGGGCALLFLLILVVTGCSVSVLS